MLFRSKGAGVHLRNGNSLQEKTLHFVKMRPKEKLIIIDELLRRRNKNEFIFKKMLTDPIAHLQYKVLFALNDALGRHDMETIDYIGDIRVLYYVLELIKAGNIGFTQDAIDVFIKNEYGDINKVIKLNKLLGALKDGGEKEVTVEGRLQFLRKTRSEERRVGKECRL